jgi:hypothetical protein
MTKLTASYVLIAAIIMAVGGQIVVNQLDQATAKQCRDHAWPVVTDQIHRDWCIGNGYKI